MKATLTFNLDDIDDRLAHYRCIKSLDMALALWEFDKYIRMLSEFERMPCGDTIRQKVVEIFDNYSIDPYELTD